MRRAVLWVTLIALGCVPVEVETWTEPDADLSHFATYAQAPLPEDEPEKAPYTPALGERIQTEIARVLDDKGYRAAPRGRADMTVAFVVAGQSRSRIVNAGDPDTDYYVPESYTEGTLIIDVFDARTGRRVWRGIGQSDLVTSGRLVPDDPERAAVEATRKILAAFPPTAS